MSEAGPLLPLFPHTASWFPTLLPSLFLWTWPHDSTVPSGKQRSAFPTAGMLGLALWLGSANGTLADATQAKAWHVHLGLPSCILRFCLSSLWKKTSPPSLLGWEMWRRPGSYLLQRDQRPAGISVLASLPFKPPSVREFVTQQKLTDELPTRSPSVCVDKAFFKRIHKYRERCMWSNI